MLTHDEALKLLKENVSNQNIFKHSLAVEATMRAVARKLKVKSKKLKIILQRAQDNAEQGRSINEDAWGLAGLLHDIDYEKTKSEPLAHGKVGAELLKKLGVEPEILHAILAHNEKTGTPRESKMDQALFAADPITGLIVAAVLIHPSKKLKNIDTQFVLNRFKEGSFARGANRENIKECEVLDLTLEEFVKIALTAMQGISEELEL